jgi:hypothetical protein
MELANTMIAPNTTLRIVDRTNSIRLSLFQAIHPADTRQNLSTTYRPAVNCRGRAVAGSDLLGGD